MSRFLMSYVAIFLFLIISQAYRLLRINHSSLRNNQRSIAAVEDSSLAPERRSLSIPALKSLSIAVPTTALPSWSVSTFSLLEEAVFRVAICREWHIFHCLSFCLVHIFFPFVFLRRQSRVMMGEKGNPVAILGHWSSAPASSAPEQRGE